MRKVEVYKTLGGVLHIDQASAVTYAQGRYEDVMNALVRGLAGLPEHSQEAIRTYIETHLDGFGNLVLFANDRTLES